MSRRFVSKIHHTPPSQIPRITERFLLKLRLADITAPIIYNQNAPFAPSQDTASSDFLDTDLVPLEAEGLASPDFHYPMSFDFQVYTDGINRGAFNNNPYMMPKTPSLLTALTVGPQYANNTETYGSQGHAIIAPHLAMMEFAVNNLDSGAHPCKSH